MHYTVNIPRVFITALCADERENIICYMHCALDEWVLLLAVNIAASQPAYVRYNVYYAICTCHRSVTNHDS